VKRVIVLRVLLCLICLAADSAHAQPGYKLSEKAIRQAKDLANKWSLQSLSQRRPAGLDDLDSAEAIKQVIEKSLRELGDGDGDVQSRAFGKLKYLGNPAFSQLVKGLESENPIVRKWCVKLLQGHGSSAVPFLSKVVRADPADYVRSTAASALGQIYDPKAIPALLAALDDQDFQVRHSAIGALINLKDQQASEPLKTILGNAQVDAQLRHAAAGALIWINREAGAKAIGEVLAKETDESLRHNLNVVLKSDYSYFYWPPDLLELRQLTRDAATLAGESFGDAEIDQLLKHIHSPHEAVLSACLRALGQLNAKTVVPAIIAGTPHDRYTFRALVKIASPQAVEYLLETIQSSDENTRVMAIGALGSHRWAVPLLIELLDDPSLRTTHKGDPFPVDAFNGIWPDGHRAHVALTGSLVMAGMRGSMINLASGKRFNVDLEIERLKVWWKEHGEAFLQGNPVPNPNITSVWLDT
jgi:HEAT repeat protein